MQVNNIYDMMNIFTLKGICNAGFDIVGRIDNPIGIIIDNEYLMLFYY